MRKRKVSLVLALLLLFTLVSAGCGGKAEEPAASEPVNETKAGSVQEADNGGGKTLKLLLSYWNIDLASDPVKKDIEEKTGYKLDVEILPNGQDPELEKLNLLLASGAEYDVVRLFTHPRNFQICAKNGYFTPLNDLLDNYPNIKSAYDDKMWSQVTLGGNTFGVPIKKNEPGASNGTAYRKEIFTKLGIAAPTTADEFKSTLVKLKESYPDMIPYTISGTGPLVDVVTSAFGFCGSLQWFTVDDKLVSKVKMPGFKDYLKYMRDLYQTGLLDKEFPSNKAENVQQKFSSGKALITEFGWNYWQSMEPTRKNIPGMEFGFLSPLKDSSGKGMISANTSYCDAAAAIPKSSKQPEEVLKFINMLLDPAAFDAIYNGTEGQEYTKDGDNFIPTDLYAKNKLTSWWWMLGSRSELQHKTFTIGVAGESPDVVNSFAALNNAAKDSYYYDQTRLMPASDIWSKYQSTLVTMVNDFTLKMIVSTEDIDKAYDEFVKQWEAEGGSQCEEGLNKVYSESRK